MVLEMWQFEVLIDVEKETDFFQNEHFNLTIFFIDQLKNIADLPLF